MLVLYSSSDINDGNGRGAGYFRLEARQARRHTHRPGATRVFGLRRRPRQPATKIHAQFALENAQQALIVRARRRAPKVPAAAAEILPPLVGGGRTLPYPTRPPLRARPALQPLRHPRRGRQHLVLGRRGLGAHNTDGLGLINDLKGFGLVSGGPALGSGGGRRCCGGGDRAAPRGGARTTRDPWQDRGPRRRAMQSFQKCSRSQQACRWRELNTRLAFDGVINADTSLSGERPPLPRSRWAPEAFAYDMMYGATATPSFSGQKAAELAPEPTASVCSWSRPRKPSPCGVAFARVRKAFGVA